MRLSAGIIVAGLIISAIVYRFACVHMDYKPADEYKLVRKWFLVLQYAYILLWETAKAVVAVLRIVFSRSINIKPRIIYFRTALKTKPALAVLANSITLMPGSVVIALEDGVFCVHCLDAKLVENIETSAPVRQLQKFEE
ncbi:MAG: Na+/H+ antiporter subunit E [Treponema sp.]|nr:Na+/H+ antiporter subunit E [Treponema sp.]